MLLHNITFVVSKSQADNFEKWITHEFKHNAENYKLANEIKKFKLETIVDNESENFSIQFFFKYRMDNELFNNTILPQFINTINTLFAGEYAYFPTLLKEF